MPMTPTRKQTGAYLAAERYADASDGRYTLSTPHEADSLSDGSDGLAPLSACANRHTQSAVLTQSSRESGILSFTLSPDSLRQPV